MTKEELYFQEIGTSILESNLSQMFGKPCFKLTNKKAFVCFYEQAMVFKLNGDAHSEAMSLDGSKLFDPSGKNRPMKEWVQVPFDYKDKWGFFSENAASYVGK